MNQYLLFIARLEFDAYRADVEQYNIVPPKDAASRAKADDTKRKFEDHKVKFDRLRGDVAIKLKFLDENRVRQLAVSNISNDLALLLSSWIFNDLKGKNGPSILPLAGVKFSTC